MAEQNFPDNVLYELDNLDVLRGMNSETVDLIATDPPFNTSRNRAGTAGFYVDKWKWGDTGKLPDQWRWNEVHPIWLEQVRDSNPALYEVIKAAGHCHGDDIAAFLCFLSVRLLEMHRVLKPTGSIYLHCDHTASGYIRMAMDAVFGTGNFRNEIVWCYTGPGNVKRWFPRKHDTIFFYVKSDAAPFNPDAVRVNYKQLNVQHLVPRDTGIGGALTPLNVENYRSRGKVPEDYWLEDRDGMTPVGRRRSENTGSPDQKPLALYKRMILASSEKGDLVLDPFAGCATTIIAAREHGRRWVGIDRRKDARFHVVCRMVGIKAADAEKYRKRPDLAKWMDGQLAKYDAHYQTSPPLRTDEGDVAAPDLPLVYLHPPKPATMPRHEMMTVLLENLGFQCWGCGFVPPKADARFFELDHREPHSAGGSNEIYNRAVLCGPCNGRKSNQMNLLQLRNQNEREGQIYGPLIDLRAATAFCDRYIRQKARTTPEQLQLGG